MSYCDIKGSMNCFISRQNGNPINIQKSVLILSFLLSQMESSKSLVAVSSPPSPSETMDLVPSEADSQLSNLVYDVLRQVQLAMEKMLKMTSEIDQSSTGIMEEIEKVKESAFERKKNVEEEKDRFQKAAYTILDLLNNR